MKKGYMKVALAILISCFLTVSEAQAQTKKPAAKPAEKLQIAREGIGIEAGAGFFGSECRLWWNVEWHGDGSTDVSAAESEIGLGSIQSP